MMKKWIEWSPPWALHVKGKYTEREVRPDGLPEEQRVVMHCTVCGDAWQTGCTSGSVRQHIQRFAFVHIHRDALAVPAKDGRP